MNYRKSDRKILIIRAGALGDTLMLMPAIAWLRDKVKIFVAGRYPGIDFLRPYVEGVSDFEGSGWYNLFTEGYHGIINMPEIQEVNHITAFLKDRAGFITANLKRIFPHATVHHFPPFSPEGEKIHIALYTARCLRQSGMPIDPLRSLEESRRHPLFNNHDPFPGKGGVVLHPGSGSRNKNYPRDLWVNMIIEMKKVYARKARGILLLFGPAEQDLIPFFQETFDGEDTELICSPEKEELISLLGGASLFIGHDSGITHLTAMLGTPVIALFRNSSPEQWMPLGPRVYVMEKKEGESGFIKDIVHRGMEILRATS